MKKLTAAILAIITGLIAVGLYSEGSFIAGFLVWIITIALIGKVVEKRLVYKGSSIVDHYGKK